MKKFLKTFSKLFICAMILGIFANASAQDSMQVFRETVEKTATLDKRVFRTDIFFVVPQMQSELEFIALSDETQFKSAGSFNCWITDDSGNTNDLEIPFYVTQNEKDMQLYFKTDKNWSKFQAPSIAAKVTDIVATPTEKEVQDMIADVKEVVILQENDSRRTILVKLDGAKIADDLLKESAQNPADNGTADDQEFQSNFMKYLDTGLRESDIWYTWTVDKKNWQTIAMSFNLASLPQSVARAALNDTSNNWSEFALNILETVAFYSETKVYITYLNDEAAKKLEIPKNVLKAKLVEDIVQTQK